MSSFIWINSHKYTHGETDCLSHLRHSFTAATHGPSSFDLRLCWWWWDKCMGKKVPKCHHMTITTRIILLITSWGRVDGTSILLGTHTDTTIDRTGRRRTRQTNRTYRNWIDNWTWGCAELSFDYGLCRALIRTIFTCATLSRGIHRAQETRDDDNILWHKLSRKKELCFQKYQARTLVPDMYIQCGPRR